MFLKSLLLLFVTFFREYSLARECNDCVAFRSCEAAVAASENILTNRKNIEEKIIKAFCGVDKYDHNMPKICCSDFLKNNFENPKCDLESHPNFLLLPQNCGRINRNLIFADPFEFPWMALLAYKTGRRYRFNCTGTIINSKYILTAAHCLARDELAGVRVGEYDMKKKIYCQDESDSEQCSYKVQNLRIEKKIPHPDYHRFPSINDIALLRLKKPIYFGHRNVHPICLPVTESLLNISLVDKIGTIAGWGFSETGIKSHILKAANLQILSTDNCSAGYDSYSSSNIQNKQFCAGEEGKDSCIGDFGGPLVIEEVYNGLMKMVQFGIVSVGAVQCGISQPGVYTDVSKYTQWILDNIEE